MLRRTLPTGLVLCLTALAACGDDGPGETPAECPGPCFTAPAPICGEDVLLTYQSFGECVDGTCMYPSSTKDCAAEGQVCDEEAGACVDAPDACTDYVCNEPPPNACESEDAVNEFAEIGTCTDVEGRPVCDYEATRDTCSRSRWCAEVEIEPGVTEGQCVPRPCYNVDCEEPPARRCVGDIVTTYEDTGTCDMDTEECVYPPATEVDCADTGQYCDRGRCVDYDPCEDVVCDEVPDVFCDSSSLHTFAAGRCSAGDCFYEETIRDCAEDGLLCRDNTCRARFPCEDVVCEDAPDPYCDGDELVTFGATGACEADDCSYPITRTNCADTDQICRSAECVDPDPCDDVLCFDRPDNFCRDSVAVRYEVPGLCEDGVCRFVDTEEDCADSGMVCFAGDCESEDPCEGVACNVLPDAYCDGGRAISFGFPGECIDGACSFTEYVDACDGFSVRCVDGECIEVDPCSGMTCSPLPEARCVGDVLYEWSGTATCTAGECNFDDLRTETDCTELGRRCHQGDCVQPGRAMGAGDLLIVEIAPSMPGGDPTLQWIEIAVAGGSADLTGLRVTNSTGGSFTLPSGSISDGYFVMGGSEAAVPGGPDYIWPDTFHIGVGSERITLLGAEEVDRLSWSALDGWTFTAGTALALSIYGETVGRNDDRAEWCNSPAPFGDGFFGTPGQANGACGGPVRAGYLRVTEVMPEGVARPGGIEQWIEVLNTTAGDLDISGVRVTTDGGAFVFPFGTMVPAGSYHVVGVDNSVADGPDSVYGLSLPIDPAGDVITLHMGATLVEEVDFSAGGTFPYDVARSMQRIGDDPNLPASWCPAGPAYTGYEENFGTPGTAAVCTD